LIAALMEGFEVQSRAGAGELVVCARYGRLVVLCAIDMHGSTGSMHGTATRHKEAQALAAAKGRIAHSFREILIENLLGSNVNQ
jgi:hypothetical protein